LRYFDNPAYQVEEFNKKIKKHEYRVSFPDEKEMNRLSETPEYIGNTFCEEHRRDIIKYF
jgi:hypothetical protein